MSLTLNDAGAGGDPWLGIAVGISMHPAMRPPGLTFVDDGGLVLTSANGEEK